MKHSIKYRFTLIFIGLLAFMLLSIWIANNWYLKTFYINEKVRVLENAYIQLNTVAKEQLDNNSNIVNALLIESEKQKEKEKEIIWRQIIQGNKQEAENKSVKGNNIENESLKILGIIQKLKEKNNVRLMMVDSNTHTGATPSPLTLEDEWLALKVQRYALGYNTGDVNVIRQHENYVIEKSYDPRNTSYFLECWGKFSDNRTLFIMSIPLSSIQDSVSLSNRFLSYVGIATLLLGSLLVYFAARGITLPIMKLAKLSEEMSNLNFSVKYEGKVTDEIGILGNSMNILSDKLKNVIEELKQANEKLQNDIQEKIQIDEIRKDFIGNVSHELKTPIALIQGYAEGLTEGMGENPESRNYYCEVIMDEANKMNKMVKQLLSLTALEFGNDTPNMECFDIVSVVQNFISSTDILIKQNRAQVILKAPEHCFVWADEYKIETVLSNYFNNAINHLDGDRIIRFQITQLESEIKISVFNTGNAIPSESISKIWTKFYKVDKARTRTYGGIGIGLSIVKAIIEAHHKSYGAINKEGGVEFWFTLDQPNLQLETDMVDND